jgi:hypothetical protein
MLAWMWPLARLLGAHLVMLIALGACLLAGNPTRATPCAAVESR